MLRNQVRLYKRGSWKLLGAFADIYIYQVQCCVEFMFPGSQPGPLRHPPPLPSAAVRPLPPMPPVLVPSPLLVPPAPGVPLMATGVSMIPPVPAAPGRNLMPTGILMDPNYCMLLCQLFCQTIVSWLVVVVMCCPELIAENSRKYWVKITVCLMI